MKKWKIAISITIIVLISWMILSAIVMTKNEKSIRLTQRCVYQLQLFELSRQYRDSTFKGGK